MVVITLTEGSARSVSTVAPQCGGGDCPVHRQAMTVSLPGLYIYAMTQREIDTGTRRLKFRLHSMRCFSMMRISVRPGVFAVWERTLLLYRVTMSGGTVVVKNLQKNVVMKANLSANYFACRSV